uniref:Putative secreted protein n=1 Tax=Anopheles triannulatus TaxID=58253 RepID=A0A2M4B0K9_9DIPT
MGPKWIGFVVLQSVILAVTSLGYSPDSFPQFSSVKHLCNVISLGGDLQILPAACVGHLGPTTNILSGASCSIDKAIIHPEYIFFNNNIAVVRLKCPWMALGSSIRIRNVTQGQLLTLMALDPQQQQPVVTPVQVESCSVCQQQYEVFDCDRQLCVGLVGMYRSLLHDLEGLSGGALYTNDGQLAGMLSYGFAGAHLVAERLAFHEPFIRHSIAVLGLGEEFEIKMFAMS